MAATIFPPLKMTMLGGRLDAGFYSITPTVAADILETRNAANRSLKPVKIDQLVHDMEIGQFVLNGESIVFADNGDLLDGQHRLEACRRSGQTIIALVVFGIPPEARGTVDQGVARTTGDILQMDGTEYGNIVAATAKLAFAYTRGDGRTLTSLARISRADIINFVNTDPAIVEAARFGVQNSSPGIASASVIGFCYWLVSQRYGHGWATDYLSKLISGEDLHLGDGALAARNRLIAQGKAPNTVRIEIILRGFVAHYEGARLSRVQVSRSLPPLPTRKRAVAETQVTRELEAA